MGIVHSMRVRRRERANQTCMGSYLLARGNVKGKGSSVWDADETIFIRTELVPAYVRLLRDNEAEVRIAAAGKVTKFCGIVTPQVAQQHILPCVKVGVL